MSASFQLLYWVNSRTWLRKTLTPLANILVYFCITTNNSLEKISREFVEILGYESSTKKFRT